MPKHDLGWSRLIKLETPPDYELKHLTDEELKHTVSCYCSTCGTQLRMHILFPRVGGLSLMHACVAKPPVVFEHTVVEIEPMETPTTNILYLDYMYIAPKREKP
jgi:hypothetical protein